MVQAQCDALKAEAQQTAARLQQLESKLEAAERDLREARQSAYQAAQSATQDKQKAHSTITNLQVWFYSAEMCLAQRDFHLPVLQANKQTLMKAKGSTSGSRAASLIVHSHMLVCAISHRLLSCCSCKWQQCGYWCASRTG